MTINDLFDLTLRVENLGGYIKAIKYYFFNHNYFTGLMRNKELVERPKADICYVLGLGPSLKNVDLNRIKGDTIVVNRFFKSGVAFPDFEPTYYMAIDKGWFMPKFQKDLQSMINIYKDKSTIYVFHPSAKQISNDLDLSNDRLYYFSAFKGAFSSNKTIDICKVMPSFGNVICNAIAFAIGLGYKEIILLGCDFNSFAFRKRVHSYGITERHLTMDYELFHYAGNARMHMELNKYATSLGIRIINSTRDSLIDAYTYEIDENLYLK